MTSKEIIKLLLKNGYVEVYCGNGSHRKYFNPSTHKTIVVPYHSKDLGVGLVNKILKQADIKKGMN